MRYDLLDVETGNVYGRFPTEDEALAFVRALIDANGAGIVETLALGGRDGAGGLPPTLAGVELARRLRANATDRLPSVRRA